MLTNTPFLCQAPGRYSVLCVKPQSTTIATLDSETDPDAQALTVALSSSSYTVLLQDGWELDSVAGDGTETPIQAALISANPQSFNIKSATDTDLTFTFTTAYATSGAATEVDGEGREARTTRPTFDLT